MSNIVGEGFPEEIIKQINVRQKKKGSYARDNQTLTWMNSNTGWVKMVSSVNIAPERFKFDNSPFGGDTSKTGNTLAKEYVLFGGVSNEIGSKTKDATQRTGIATDGSIFNQNAYGLGGLEYGGLRPMPGITSFSIKTETRGSLKTATIGIKAYNKYQFDIISTLYMSLGYSILLEWGNTMYYDNKEDFQSNNQFSLTDEFLGDNSGNVTAEYKWNKILPKIQEKRLASKGNYDAALGKVVNFTWSIDRDLSYNITVTVRTIGDIIESLKINTINGQSVNIDLPSIEKIQPGSEEANKLNPQEKIANYAFSSDIGKLFYRVQKAVENGTEVPNYGAYYITDRNDANNRIAVKQVYRDDKPNEYYIQFGYFLRLLTTYIIPRVDNNPDQLLINIDTDTDSNIIALYNREISADPSVCMVKTEFIGPFGQQAFAFFQGGNDFRFKPKGATTLNYGKVMNIYFNMVYILDQLESLKDPKEDKVVLVDLLKKICDGFNTSTGGFNKLQPVVDETTNTITFIDEVPLPEKDAILKAKDISTETAKFLMYGITGTAKTGINEASIVRDLSFSTTITPALASMITIGAQSNGYIVGQDSTALSTINKGLIDRVKNEITDPLPSDAPPPDPTTPPEPLDLKYKEQIKAFYGYLEKLGPNKNYPEWDDNAISNFKNTNIQFTEYDQYKQVRDKQLADSTSKTQPQSPTIGFLPFNLTLTIDGLSGMKVYQKYTIDSTFLPTSYPDTLEFLIMGITHEIINNQWITTLESVAVPKNPFNSPDIQLNTTYRSQPTTSNVQTSALTTSLNAKTAYDFFISKGFKNFQAAAWVGNLYQESRLDPTIVNSIGATGIAQWLGTRKTNLLKKKNYLSLQTQLNFIWEELQGPEIGAYRAIKATTNISDAALTIRKKYERPGESEANDAARLQYAKATLEQQTGKKLLV